MTVNAFMTQHIVALSQRYRVTIALNGSSDQLRPELRHIPLVTIPIARPIAPIRDFLALAALWRLLRRERFDIVHSISPKAGLIAMVAGRLARVPIRIHWFTGQVWATRRGLMRTLIKSMDCVTARCATHLLADSRSQAEFLVAEGVAKRNRIKVLAAGSVCGVDLSRFRPDPKARSKVRVEHDLPGDAVVALFIGRVTRDKGIGELATAFLGAAKACPKLHLVVVGPDEDGMETAARATLAPVIDRLRWIGFTAKPEEFMAAADFFVLPSYREGFGSVVIEAAACGIPSIGSDIYGVRDAIADGETGLLVRVGSAEDLQAAMKQLALDERGRQAMGERALGRVALHFRQEMLVDALQEYYGRLPAPALR